MKGLRSWRDVLYVVGRLGLYIRAVGVWVNGRINGRAGGYR